MDLWSLYETDDGDNIVAIFEHRDRVRKIYLPFRTTSLVSERLVTMMQEPFPALTYLHLEAECDGPALPDMFLDGSAPRLQSLELWGIPFPGLPRLLLSATDLSSVSLERIPYNSYISPEVMVTCLSTLTRLRYLSIKFEFPTSRPDRRDRRPPPLPRVILSSLQWLELRGVSGYLEDFVAQIDAPRLDSLHISFFNQLIFDIQQLPQFIGRTGILRSYNRTEVVFGRHSVKIVLRLAELANSHQEPTLEIFCKDIDWQVLCMA